MGHHFESLDIVNKGCERKYRLNSIGDPTNREQVGSGNVETGDGTETH